MKKRLSFLVIILSALTFSCSKSNTSSPRTSFIYAGTYVGTYNGTAVTVVVSKGTDASHITVALNGTSSVVAAFVGTNYTSYASPANVIPNSEGTFHDDKTMEFLWHGDGGNNIGATLTRQ